MAQTVTSSAASYCSAADLFEFIDGVQVAGLLRDDPTDDLPTETEMKDAGDPAGARLLKLLRAGSGEVEAACLPRGQYSVADLEAIAGSDTNAAYHLKRVVAGCAIMAAFARRHNASRTNAEDYPAVVHARDALERLRVGEHVFGLAANVEAGKGISAIEFVGRADDDAGRTVNVARRFFGSAGQRGGW